MTPDTSVLVAGFASWHEYHDAARAALVEVDVLVAHAVIETFSVLTRLPGDRQVPPQLAVRYLEQFARRAPLTLSGRATAELPRRLAEAGIDGGATYDALIGWTAAAHDQVLLTRDLRAVRTYERLGVAHRIVR